MKIVFYAVFGMWVILRQFSHGEVIKMDFTKSHTLEDIKGLEVFNMYQRSVDGDESYYAKDVNLSISLPGGQQIGTATQSVMIRARADGSIHNIELLGPIMPQEEAYNAGKRLYSAFSIPYERLENWRMAVEAEVGAPKTVANAQGLYYPHIFIEIRHSMNRLYPWTILMSLGWIDEDEEKHNESWGLENNPRPPAGLETVSLEPPSGRTYSRADAWDEANRRQEELDKRLDQVRGPDGQLIEYAERSNRDRPDRRPQLQDEEPSRNAGISSAWWLMLLPFMIICGFFAFRFFTRSHAKS